MDMRDKQFDTWIRDSLEIEIPINKQMKQATWEQICLIAEQPEPLTATAHESPPVQIPSPIPRLWTELLRLVTQEKTYHTACAKRAEQYKPDSNYYGRLSLHNMEMMRQRWAFPI